MSTPPDEPGPVQIPTTPGTSAPPGEDDAGSPSAPSKATLRARADELRARTEQTKQALGARAGELEARHASVRVAFAAYRRDRRQAGGLLAGGLAFRLFLWLLPTALAIASAVRLLSDATARSPEAMAEDMGLGAALTAAVAAGARDSGRGTVALLVLGVLLMLWAANGMVKGLRLLAAVTWQIRPGQQKGALRWAAGFSGVALGVLVLPVLLGPLYGGGFGSDLAVSLLTIAILAALMVWVMGRLPHPEDVGWAGLLPGAVLVGLGAEILRLVTAVYLAPRLARTEDLYGALGLAAVFLTWLYLGGRILVGGFALNAERWRATRPAEATDDRDDAAGP
jgi:uncharacterized BrkB/YihY/UPF0761 family membrane protein